MCWLFPAAAACLACSLSIRSAPVAVSVQHVPGVLQTCSFGNGSSSVLACASATHGLVPRPLAVCKSTISNCAAADTISCLCSRSLHDLFSLIAGAGRLAGRQQTAQPQPRPRLSGCVPGPSPRRQPRGHTRSVLTRQREGCAGSRSQCRVLSAAIECCSSQKHAGFGSLLKAVLATDQVLCCCPSGGCNLFC